MRRALALLLLTASFAHAQSPHDRAAALVGKMTLDEKIAQMSNDAAAIPRLNIPAYDYWNEGLHGVARAGYATMFPQAIGMAATFDAPLLHQVGDVIATEARAKNNDALRRGNHGIYYGLTFWSPNINIFRDPRWGRGQETYGEDPFLSGTLGAAFVKGLQGDDPRYFKVIATPKHFAVHSGPERGRHAFNVDPSPHDLYDTYLPQFRMAIVDGKADSIMCAYNALDRTPACANKQMLQTILRDTWKFAGFVTSDCGAIDDFYMENSHKTEPDAAHADRDALVAGTDTSCGHTYSRALGKAVHDGLITEAVIDNSLTRLFEARLRLGLFDPPAQVPYAAIPFSAVHAPAHVAAALRTARESMVLLRNDGILPLDPATTQRIAIVGPNAASLASLEGNYYGTPHNPMLPVDALAKALPHATVTYAPGAPYINGFRLTVPRTVVTTSAGAAQGWHAEYFDRPGFDGEPIRTATDPEIDFDWNHINPLHEGASTGFAVRWIGTLRLPAAGTYALRIASGPCDGCKTMQRFRVLLDGKLVAASANARPAENTAVIDNTTGLPAESANLKPEFALTATKSGETHTITVEFVRDSGEQGSGISLQFTPPPDVLLPDALAAARDADVIIAMLGLSPLLEGEELKGVNLPGFDGGDRTSLALPAAQEKLLRAMLNTGKPVIVVLLNGSALAVNTADRRAAAILEAWYPGEAGAQAIADTLTGANNPSGRLPITFYRADSDLPPFTDYSMRDRTYRYFTGTPLYGFGYGLSYTTFAYAPVKLSKATLNAGETLTATTTVTNTGTRPGDDVAQLYIAPPVTGNGGLSPRLRLAGVQRVTLQPGETRTITFTLPPRLLSEVDAQGHRAVQPGTVRISIGGAQPGDPKAQAKAESATLTIRGSQAVPESASGR